MRTQIYSKVVWGNKEKQTPSKRMEVVADNYDAYLVFSTRDANGEGSFDEVTSVKIDKDAFTALARGCFRKASGAINRGSFKTSDLTENKLLCDYAWNNKDLQVIRVTSIIKVGGTNKYPTRSTRISVYRFDSWDSFKEARNNSKGGALSFPSEKCLFSMELPVFSVVQNAWYSEDVQCFDDLDDVFMGLFKKYGSYNSFLDRVYNANKDGNNSDSAKDEAPSSSSSQSTPAPVADGYEDDEFPF